MKTKGLFRVVLPLVFLVNTLTGEDLSLRPEATSSSLRFDTKPFATQQPVSTVYDFRPLGGKPQAQSNLEVSPIYSERMILRTRVPVSEGIAIVNSAGVGLNRTGSVWHFLTRKSEGQEQSLMFDDTGVEINPAPFASFRFSTRLAREVDDSGNERTDWSGGAVMKMTPVDGTTMYAGAFRGQNLQTRYQSNIFTAGLDSRVANTPLMIGVSGWRALDAHPSGGAEQYSNGGAIASVSLQMNSALWLGAGVQWDASDGWNARYSSSRYYFSTVFQASPRTSFGLEVSHAMGSYEDLGKSDVSDFSETRLRLSCVQRLIENFSTEISVEVQVGNQGVDALLDVPLVRLAGQFSF